MGNTITTTSIDNNNSNHQNNNYARRYYREYNMTGKGVTKFTNNANYNTTITNSSTPSFQASRLQAPLL